MTFHVRKSVQSYQFNASIESSLKLLIKQLLELKCMAVEENSFIFSRDRDQELRTCSVRRPVSNDG